MGSPASSTTSLGLYGSNSIARRGKGGDVCMSRPFRPPQEQQESGSQGQAASQAAPAVSFRTSNARALHQLHHSPAGPDIQQRDACLKDGIHLKACLDAALGCLKLQKPPSSDAPGAAQQAAGAAAPCRGIIAGGYVAPRDRIACCCHVHGQSSCTLHGFITEQQRSGFTVLGRKLGKEGNLDWLDIHLPYPACPVTVSDLCQSAVSTDTSSAQAACSGGDGGRLAGSRAMGTDAAHELLFALMLDGLVPSTLSLSLSHGPEYKPHEASTPASRYMGWPPPHKSLGYRRVFESEAQAQASGLGSWEWVYVFVCKHKGCCTMSKGDKNRYAEYLAFACMVFNPSGRCSTSCSAACGAAMHVCID